jgi:RNA polymerase sigma-70 factor (ECF subfamily)
MKGSGMRNSQVCTVKKSEFSHDDVSNLVMRIKGEEKDEKAVEFLYMLFVDDIYRFFRNRVPYLSDVNDLTSETFVIMLKNINKLEKNECFHSWLFGIALNLLRKYYKKKKREIDDLIYEGSAEFQNILSEIPAPHHLPDNSIDKKYLRLYLGQMMNKMKKDQQLALHLRFYEGLKVKEIANKMRKSEEAVKSLLFRSQKALYKLLLKKFRSNRKDAMLHQMEVLSISSES